ncbi:hypothetical protein [Novosphingobium sp.]|uniref:hypothetical protein n=1 Tax=Novosphingobium sp. TaxID=1874826 RepID=UPI0038BAA649
MATAKFTIQRGKVDLKDVTIAAGTAEAQSDTISLNIDYTNMTKGDVLMMLDELKQKVFASPFPPL